MSTFKENFKKQWGKSFGEDKLLERPRGPGIYPVDPATLEPYPPEMIKQEPAGILRRIWNDAVRGGDHKSRELETPAVIYAARGIGKVLGMGTALATIGTMICGLFTSTAAIPVLPVISSLMGLGTLGGAIYGIFTKPEAKKPYEMLVHHDHGAGVRDYDMITVQPPVPGFKDKLSHIMDKAVDGWKLPLVGAYRAINTPIRLTGYAAHAFGTAVSAAVETYKDNHAPPAPAAQAPVEKHDFTI